MDFRKKSWRDDCASRTDAPPESKSRANAITEAKEWGITEPKSLEIATLMVSNRHRCERGWHVRSCRCPEQLVANVSSRPYKNDLFTSPRYWPADETFFKVMGCVDRQRPDHTSGAQPPFGILRARFDLSDRREPG